jgi:FkbM family methyltransferase
MVGYLLPRAARKTLRYYYACGIERLGVNYYPAHDGLDRKLLAYFGGLRDGTFVEAGANDGLSQSNTWYLERKLGWRGLLIEPVPEMATLCRRFRKSHVECSALGSFEQAGLTVMMHYGGLMTTAAGADEQHLSGGTAETHAKVGASWVSEESYEFESILNPLSALIDRVGLAGIDLLSLDVEGFEVNVLSGIDFDRHPIRHILIETSNVNAVQNKLGSRYALVNNLSRHDYLFRRV